jgi:(2Fe-2S) ferredoxin
MLFPDLVTLMPIGPSGFGKSELLNSYLQMAAFTPDSGMLETGSTENTIDGITRMGIDTPGLDDAVGVDVKHIQRLMGFLHSWPHGVNVITIVIDGWRDTLTDGTRHMVRLLNAFFNTPSFWDHVCIVVTKCFSRMRVAEVHGRYQQLLLGTAPQPPPVFLVDSPAWNWDADTLSDLEALHNFVCQLDPMLINRKPRPTYIRVKWEERRNVLVGTHIEGGVRVQTYQDQQRERRTHDDGDTVTFREWTPTRTREVRKTSSVRREKVTEEIARSVAGWSRGARRAGCGAKIGMTTFQEKERTVRTDVDGGINHGEWIVIRTWTSRGSASQK